MGESFSMDQKPNLSPNGTYISQEGTHPLRREPSPQWLPCVAAAPTVWGSRFGLRMAETSAFLGVGMPSM